MSHVWREVVEREKGPEQLPHLATQGPRLGCGFAHVRDPPCHSGGHSLGSALRSAYFALSFKKLPLPLLTSSLSSGALGPLRPPLAWSACLKTLAVEVAACRGKGSQHLPIESLSSV